MLGTAALAMVINLSSADGGGIFQLPAICSCLLCNVIIFGPVSGCHVNPAITVAQLLGYVGTPVFKRKSLFAFAMLAGQFIGAGLGCFVVYCMSITNADARTITPKPALLCPHPDFSKEGNLCAVLAGGHARIFLAEMVFTGIFVTTILSLIYHKNLDFTATSIVVGMALFSNLNGAMQVSGACINPAIGLAQSIFQSFIVPKYYNTFNDTGKTFAFTVGFEPMWAYILGPFAGSLLAATFKYYDCHVETSTRNPDNNPVRAKVGSSDDDSYRNANAPLLGHD